MTKIAVLMGLLLFSNCLFSQSLNWKTKLRSDGATVIYRSADGYNNLKDAINSVPINSWITHIAASDLLEHTSFHSEVFSYLKIKYPDELASALGSAGNMHNPAVKNIQEGFKEAVLNSVFTKELNIAFADRCERVTEVNIEKFFIYRDSGEPKFSSFLWLSTDECT